jgi:hypothetical protein
VHAGRTVAASAPRARTAPASSPPPPLRRRADSKAEAAQSSQRVELAEPLSERRVGAPLQDVLDDGGQDLGGPARGGGGGMQGGAQDGARGGTRTCRGGARPTATELPLRRLPVRHLCGLHRWRFGVTTPGGARAALGRIYTFPHRHLAHHGRPRRAMVGTGPELRLLTLQLLFFLRPLSASALLARVLRRRPSRRCRTRTEEHWGAGRGSLRLGRRPTSLRTPPPAFPSPSYPGGAALGVRVMGAPSREGASMGETEEATDGTHERNGSPAGSMNFFERLA